MDAKRTRVLIKLGVTSLFCVTLAWAADHAVFSSVFLALGAVAAFGAAASKATPLKWEASMAVSFINDPEHWRNRSEEARTLADQMNDETSKQMMLRIAADYERLAERAVQRAQGASSTPPKSSSPAG